MPRYNPAIEEQRTAFYQSLSEKDRRRYAAIEAGKLGRGGLNKTSSGKAGGLEDVNRSKRSLL